MKLLGRSRSPDQRLREAVDTGGSVSLRVSDLLRARGQTSPTAGSLGRVSRGLHSVGLAAEPPLDGVAWDQVVTVRRADAQPTAVRAVPDPMPGDQPFEDAVDEAVTLAQRPESEPEEDQVEPQYAEDPDDPVQPESAAEPVVTVQPDSAPEPVVAGRPDSAPDP